MTKKTCFVVMAIGDQEFDGQTIRRSDLRSRYDDLIREALLRARPDLDIKRADDISAPGTITTDIVTRIMRSDYVVADVTYPNPNVFYELGLRHASKPGTIIIKDLSGPRAPFDISHLRHIGYEHSLPGLKVLATELSKSFAHFEEDPVHTDNHFLEIAKLTKFEFQDYRKTPEAPPEVAAMMAIMGSPELIDLFSRSQNGEEVNPAELIKALASNPGMAAPLLTALSNAGVFK
ncbi:hypothetical protein ACIOZM_08070 [Pseudomonas sp. NPDC087346]|uniref:hypothetical protein n=1 Tax=Pseudomonas sp. NPDC087346 TaxID=3364438 RepID=UPI003803F49A